MLDWIWSGGIPTMYKIIIFSGIHVLVSVMVINKCVTVWFYQHSLHNLITFLLF